MNKKKINLEVITTLLTALIPRMDNATKRQMLSLISSVMVCMFLSSQCISPASAAEGASYVIDKTVTNVGDNGPEGNVTKAGDIIGYQVNVTNDGNISLTNVTVTDPLINLTVPTESNNNDLVLEVGENWTYTGNYTVTQADLNSNGTAGDGFINNNATVDCEQLDPQNDSVQVRIEQNANCTIDKIVTDVSGNGPSANVTKEGDIIGYQVNVTNDGNIDLTNVNVTDSLINLTGPIEPNNNDTVLNVGESWIYTGNYTVTRADLNNNGTAGDGFINNNATVDCDQLDPQNDSVQVPIDTACSIYKIVTDVSGNGPSANVTKEGDVITYQVKVTNDGKTDLTNVTVNDTLIDLTGPVQSNSNDTNSNDTNSNDTNSNDTNSNDTILGVGENWTYTGNYTVTRADITSNGNGTGFINNNATINCDQLGPKSASVEVPIDTAGSIDGIVTDVAGQGSGGNVTKAGDVISYLVNVTNDGKTDLTNVTVTDSLNSLTEPIPSMNNDTVLDVGETWTYTGNYTVTQADINSNGTVDNNNGTIDNGNGTIDNSNGTIEHNNRIVNSDGIVGNSDGIAGNGFIKNTATFNCDQLGPKSDIIEVPIERNPNYSIFKSVIGPDEDGDCIVNSPGDEVPYRIVIKNDGNVDLTGVSVDDPMIILKGPTGDDIDLEVLNPGETWVYNGIYELTPDDINNGNGYIDNTAAVNSNELPEKTSNVNQPIDQNADLSIQKSVIGIDEAGDYMINQPGDVINYQIAVKNNGDVDLTGISVDDPMITLTGPTGDSINPGVLNPGETWVYTGDYEVTQADIDGSGFIENTATVSSNELSTSESSSTVLPIIPIPPIIITPETDNSPVADFNVDPTSGYAPLSVKFTDLSQNAASRSWDFNNDGIADSSEVSPVHVYTAPGTYTAKLTVSDANGTDSKTATINVLQVTSPSGGSSGGSSHSSGGSSSGVIVKSSEVSNSTGKTNATGTVIQPENKTQVEQKTETTAANVEQTPEQKSTPAKESKRTPGFEIIFGIVGLFSVFLYRRK